MPDAPMPEMVERVARGLCRLRVERNMGFPDYYTEEMTPERIEVAIDYGWTNFVIEARAAINAYEAAKAEEMAVKWHANNIAYLQANIAQMDKFMARDEADDPIGHMQWADRKADFQRQLDAALSSEEP